MVWTPLRLYLISTIYYNYKSDLKKNNLYRCFFSKKLYICNAYHLKQARWLAILCCGHFLCLVVYYIV